MVEDVEDLITQTLRWRALHVAAGRHIEAAACTVRLRALREARDAALAPPPGPDVVDRSALNDAPEPGTDPPS